MTVPMPRYYGERKAGLPFYSRAPYISRVGATRLWR